MRLKPFLLASALATTGLSACATFEDVETEELALPADYEYAARAVETAQPDPAWWSQFGDGELNTLINEAMAENITLEAGVQRVEQARAQLRIAGANLLPSVNAAADVSGSYSDADSSFGGIGDGDIPGGGDFNTDDFRTSGSAGIGASYELDLFGRNRAQVRGAEAQLAAQLFNQQALALTVQADTAATYINYLALRERLEVAQSNLDAVERILELVETQYEAGAVSGFDLARQRSAVASARAQIRPLVEQTRQTEIALAVLLGLPPENFEAPAGDLFTLNTPSIETGLPSDLLLRRPDLLGAEASLSAADANIDVARAAFFPTINLSAGLNAQNIFDSANLVASLASGLTTPIFQGGRLEGNLDLAEAQYKEIAANYRQTILVSLQEVENALVSLQSGREREDLLEEASEQADRALEIAEIRYQAGADDLLAVLDAQQQQLSARDNLVQARQQRLTTSVDLYRALGGGWDEQAMAAAEKLRGDGEAPRELASAE